MTRKKHPPEASTVRSSAAEYLTFVAATGSQQQAVEMRYEDENIWLSQKMMATLYDVTVPAINQHLKRIFKDRELVEEAVIKQYLTTAADGKTYNVKHYNLQAIIAVGFKIENDRAVQFRKWATQVVKDYTIQGWVMDVDRLKSGGSVLTQELFDRQLEKVREIRLSERKFYQKITDIYATSVDYDATTAATQRFLAAVQNKSHFAVHGQTAAEVIVERADAEQPHMGLTTWEGAPQTGSSRATSIGSWPRPSTSARARRRPRLRKERSHGAARSDCRRSCPRGLRSGRARQPGLKLSDERYDDGGFTGANIDRPAFCPRRFDRAYFEAR